MATEKINFKLELFAEMWDQPPCCEVLINEKSFFNGPIDNTESDPKVITFEHTLDEQCDYELVIERTNKGRDQCVVDDQGNVIKDQLLNIKKIEIDDVDIGALVYDGVYRPYYPEPWATQQRQSGKQLAPTFKNVTKMGFNGIWRLKFTSPFYIWLLENLY